MLTYPRVAILGDSLTFGSAASQSCNTWAFLVLNALRQRNAANAQWTLVNGVPGINVQNTILTMQQMAFVPAADLYIVELGTNDFGLSKDIPNFQAQYGAMVTNQLLKANPQATIVALTLWRGSSEIDALGNTAADFATAIGNIINGCAAPTKAVVDLMSLYANSAYHNTTPVGGVTDVFHPNDAGHQAIASAVLAAIP